MPIFRCMVRRTTTWTAKVFHIVAAAHLIRASLAATHWSSRSLVAKLGLSQNTMLVLCVGEKSQIPAFGT